MAANKSGSNVLLVLMIVVSGAGVVGGLYWWLDSRDRERSSHNDRSTHTTLMNLIRAEWDYREKDLDGNGVHDFWTGDLAGLHRHGLISKGLAEADAAPLASSLPNAEPLEGYLFKALSADPTMTPPELYAQDTDGKSGKVHHRAKFGFVAYPARPGRTGHWILIVNEYNAIFYADVNRVPVPKDWPTDKELKSFWGKPGG